MKNNHQDIQNLYKIVLVEDEPRILENIKTKIEKACQGFTVIASTFNGVDALKLIARTNPDVLCTDIRMPIMDGLELIKEVRKRHPEMPIIIISGYDEFDYARKAIKYDVREYLLKPIKINSLKKTLSKIKARLDVSATDFEKDTLSSLVNSLDPKIPIPAKLNGRYYSIFLLCAGNLCNQFFSEKLINKFKSCWDKIKWDTVIPELMGVSEDEKKWWIIDGPLLNQKFLVIPPDGDFRDIYSTSNNLKEKISTLIKPLNITICTPSDIIPISKLNMICQQLTITLNKGLIMGRSQVLELNKTQNNKSWPVLLEPYQEHKITTLIQRNEIDLLREETINLFRSWESNEITQSLIEKNLELLIELFRQQIISISEDKIITLEKKLFEKIALAASFNKICDDVWQLFQVYLISDDKKNKTTKEITKEIESYIRTNFNKPISLEDIANKFAFSPSYLTKIFNNHIGQTPNKFIIYLRIEEAKQLIKSCPDLSLKEIGEIVGYPNQYYFSRIFKIITGKTPSRYRSKKYL